MKCWCLLLAAVLTLRSNSTRADFVNENVLTLVSSFLDENGITFLVVINCGAAGNDTSLEPGNVCLMSYCTLCLRMFCTVCLRMSYTVSQSFLYCVPQNVLYRMPQKFQYRVSRNVFCYFPLCKNGLTHTAI